MAVAEVAPEVKVILVVQVVAVVIYRLLVLLELLVKGKMVAVV
jgi:hypothetical protein